MQGWWVLSSSFSSVRLDSSSKDAASPQLLSSPFGWKDGDCSQD